MTSGTRVVEEISTYSLEEICLTGEILEVLWTSRPSSSRYQDPELGPIGMRNKIRKNVEKSDK